MQQTITPSCWLKLLISPKQLVITLVQGVNIMKGEKENVAILTSLEHFPKNLVFLTTVIEQGRGCATVASVRGQVYKNTNATKIKSILYSTHTHKRANENEGICLFFYLLIYFLLWCQPSLPSHDWKWVQKQISWQGIMKNLTQTFLQLPFLAQLTVCCTLYSIALGDITIFGITKIISSWKDKLSTITYSGR